MFTLQKHELFMVLWLLKVATLRPFKPNFKGCFKVGSEQQIKLGRFDKTFCFKVRITNRYFINVNQLTEYEFIKLGYGSKSEYMNQPYNKNNPSNLRTKYEFELIEVNETRLKELNII